MERATTSLPPSAATTRASSPKRLNVFERSLSLRVGFCMVVGVMPRLTAPGKMQGLGGLEFGAGSQINVPMAILIWLMITPMFRRGWNASTTRSWSTRTSPTGGWNCCTPM